jgi:uncharacterized membrane-anchored protein
MRKLVMLACISALSLLPMQLFAEEMETEEVTAEQFLSSFNYQKGLIDLPNGVAQLDVPEEFRYIDAGDAKRFLEEGWGNPDGSGTLGMLLPVDSDLFGPEGWVVVITYQEDGYVSDEDASDIDYNELLVSMQEANKEANEERRKLGYQKLSLVGWARPPHYDSEAKKLYWAKELQAEGAEETTLNYNVRILGRKGVLVMNAVSGMSQLPLIEGRMNQVLAFSDFKEGYRYSDYEAGVDKVAAYGLAALIGGKIAAKVGLLAKLGGLLVAFKKVIIIGLAAVGGFFTKLFKRRKVAAE